MNLCLPAARWQLRKEAVQGVLFPRRCPFCDCVIGFAAKCDSETCNNACEAQKQKVKTLDTAEYYLGNLAGAAAVYRHKSTPRDAVLRLKYGGMQSTGRTLGNIMAEELFGCTFSKKYGIVIPNSLQLHAGYHVVVPVPPSSKSRGYNVPTLLAQPLGLLFGAQIISDALRRARFTTRQASLSFDGRFANVAGAFAAREDLDLTGKNVLLVDDVITTGATVAACAQALYCAGAQSVFAVSFTAGSKRDVLNESSKKIDNT